MSNIKKVAFQGVNGAYSQEAIYKFFGKNNIETISCKSFFDILELIMLDKTDFAILPVENSLAGTVIPAYDELIKFSLRVFAEVILKVEHCLLAPKNHTKLKNVYSHYQALSQCHRNSLQMKLEEHQFYDTAGSAKWLSENPQEYNACIASKLAGEIYNLKIVQNNFEDENFNFTRFFVLKKHNENKYNPNEKYKTSIIFATKHKPYALVDALNCLSNNNINMTKIESRPSKNRAWNYLFFVDFEGHEDEEKVQKAFLGILKHASFLKVLGSYKSYKTYKTYK